MVGLLKEDVKLKARTLCPAPLTCLPNAQYGGDSRHVSFLLATTSASARPLVGVRALFYSADKSSEREVRMTDAECRILRPFLEAQWKKTRAEYSATAARFGSCRL